MFTDMYSHLVEGKKKEKLENCKPQTQKKEDNLLNNKK